MSCDYYFMKSNQLTVFFCFVALYQGIVPRPVTQSPSNHDELSRERCRTKLIKRTPSILSRPPIIQTLVRGEMIKDHVGSTQQVILSLPTKSSMSPKVVPVSLTQATNSAIENISSPIKSANIVPVSLLQTVIPVLSANAVSEATTTNASSGELHVKTEQPAEVTEAHFDLQSDSFISTDPPVKDEVPDEDVKQYLFESDADFAQQSDEKIVPDDGDSIDDGNSDADGKDDDVDDDEDNVDDVDTRREITKRPRMTLDLPCPDERFVFSRQNVLDTMKFCCECGTRVSERYYSDKVDRLAVTLVCEQGHTVDWNLQKIGRKKSSLSKSENVRHRQTEESPQPMETR